MGGRSIPRYTLRWTGVRAFVCVYVCVRVRVCVVVDGDFGKAPKTSPGPSPCLSSR